MLLHLDDFISTVLSFSHGPIHLRDTSRARKSVNLRKLSLLTFGYWYIIYDMGVYNLSCIYSKLENGDTGCLKWYTSGPLVGVSKKFFKFSETEFPSPARGAVS
jgi:hypothetical protein